MARSLESPLDCSKPRNAVFWCTAGMLLALGCMFAQSHGHWATLLRVGSANPRLPQIEKEIGPVHPQDFRGHDGQFNYVIGRDPFPAPESVVLSPYDNNGPIYRYRRILLPVVAGGFGQFNGPTTLAFIVALVALGVGLSAIGSADLALQWNRPGWAAIAAAANAGVIVSTLILSVDSLALGLALCGVAAFARGQMRIASAIFSASILTKEVYAVVPLALAAWSWREHRREATAWLTLSLVPGVLWSGHLLAAFPGPKSAGASGFSLPFTGPIDGVRIWISSERELTELLLIGFIVIMLALAAVAMIKGDRLLRYLLAPWLVLFVCSSFWVWSKPNNPARTFAIVWPLAVLSVAPVTVTKSARRQN